MKMGGTGSAQEDQIITIQLEHALGVKFTYVPFKGGGEVCVNLVGKHIDSTVNNPAECVSHWKAGRVRPARVSSTRARIANVPIGRTIPTIKEALGSRHPAISCCAASSRAPAMLEGRGRLA